MQQTSAQEMRQMLDEMAPTKHKDTGKQIAITEDNPISLFFTSCRYNTNDEITDLNGNKVDMTRYLNEGIFKTYPVDTTIRYLQDYFGLDYNNIFKMSGNQDKPRIGIFLHKGQPFPKQLHDALTMCGYYRAAEQERPHPIDLTRGILYQYEERNSKDDSEEIRSSQMHLYHLSPQYNNGKIKHLGLCPVSKNSVFKYPGRVYLMLGSSNDAALIHMAKRLSDANTSPANNHIYYVYDIDINAIPKDHAIFYDPNAQGSVYTSANIPPSAIIRTGYIDLNDRNPRIEWR